MRAQKSFLCNRTNCPRHKISQEEISMTEIKISASQIFEVQYKTTLAEGKDRLPRYYHSFWRLEGIPIVEEIGNERYRLITYYENYVFYNIHKPNEVFACDIKEFGKDEDRYLEILRTLFHGKARRKKKDKYHIINLLYMTLPVEEMAAQSDIDAKLINEFIYENDKYKRFREYAMESGKLSLVENIVKYLRKYDIFKEITEDYLLSLDTTLTWNYWEMITFVLEGISTKFVLLAADDQIRLLNEIEKASMKILTNYFSQRCDEILFIPPNDDDYHRPTIQ